MAETKFGPGTITIGEAPDTPIDIACEVLGGKVTHEYEEVGEARTMLCGEERGTSDTLKDGVTLQLENDLTAAGIYAYIQALPVGSTKTISFIPNTAGAAEWSGTVKMRLPADIGADEFGAPITSEVSWPAVGKLLFTPATDPAP
jgi:hypothetical protein